MTREKPDKLNGLTETLKELTINHTGYYVSDSENIDDAKGDTVSNPKTVTHTRYGKKIKFMDTSNRILQKNY